LPKEPRPFGAAAVEVLRDKCSVILYKLIVSREIGRRYDECAIRRSRSGNQHLRARILCQGAPGCPAWPDLQWYGRELGRAPACRSGFLVEGVAADRSVQRFAFVHHRNLPVELEHFDRWLALFEETVKSTLPAAYAEKALAKAHHMAESFKAGIFPFVDKSGRPARHPN